MCFSDPAQYSYRLVVIVIVIIIMLMVIPGSSRTIKRWILRSLPSDPESGSL